MLNFSLSPKRLFLIDSLGAVITALSLGATLPYFQSYIGMPTHILYSLACIAGVFAVYSLTSHFRLPSNWRIFLKIIAVANFLYCGLTLGLVLYFWQQLTWVGVSYFLLEMMVIVVLATVELRVAHRYNHQHS